MGEEWGSKAPFPFFCDFKGNLAEAVRQGRRREYSWAYAKHGDDVPDPLHEATFKSAILDWESRGEAAGCRRLNLVRDLLALRRREIMPQLAKTSFESAHAADNGLLTASWRIGDGTRFKLKANLSTGEIVDGAGETSGVAIYGGTPSGSLPPWSVFWSLEKR